MENFTFIEHPVVEMISQTRHKRCGLDPDLSICCKTNEQVWVLWLRGLQTHNYHIYINFITDRAHWCAIIFWVPGHKGLNYFIIINLVLQFSTSCSACMIWSWNENRFPENWLKSIDVIFLRGIQINRDLKILHEFSQRM